MRKNIMRHHRVLSVILTLSLFLTGWALPAFSQSPVSTQNAEKSPVLQLDKPLRFPNTTGLPIDISSGTYQVTAPSPVTLELKSTLTGESHNLHATPMAHTESLNTPYVFLIEEAENHEHIHLVALLPDGKGFDAEGRWEPVQSRGIGEITRFAFRPNRQYTGVVLQQGRVTTDDDFNEQEAVSSSAASRFPSKVTPSYGRVTLEQGHLTLDFDARKSLRKRCRFCAKNP